jgi:DNA repair exonuclease SbcCD ATPase subunit
VRNTMGKIAEALNEAKAEQREQQQIAKQISSYVTMIETLENKANPFDGQLEQISKDLETLSGETAEKEKEIESRIKETAKYEFWQKYFPMVRLFILEKVTKHLELCFTQAFGKMGLGSWEVKVSTERELKNENIKKELNVQFFDKGKEIKFSSLSGGEAQRVRLATALGVSDLVLGKLSRELKIRIFDEPSLGLSLQGQEDLLAMLKDASEDHQIYLAEHRIVELQKFDKVYNVVKNEGGSFIASSPSPTPAVV